MNSTTSTGDALLAWAPDTISFLPLRHCEEHPDQRSALSGHRPRGNPFLHLVRWIASRSLSSGAHSRDPLAHNVLIKFTRTHLKPAMLLSNSRRSACSYRTGRPARRG